MNALVAAGVAALAVWLWIPTPNLVRLGAAARTSAAPALLDALRGWWRRPRRPRTLRAGVASVPWTCELLALGLGAGAPPRVALDHVARVADGPVRDSCENVLRQIELGVDEPEAWLSLADAPGYQQVARDVARSLRRGSAMAELLRRHAAQARSDAQAHALARARVAGVRSVVPLVSCFLPAFLLVGVVPVLASTFAGALG